MRRFLLAMLAVTIPSAAQPQIQGVFNAASYSELIAPGCWVVIFGNGLAGSEQLAQSVPLPTSLAGVSVSIDGKAAPLLYVSSRQINALVPFEVASSDNRSTAVTVTTGSGTATFPVYLNRNAPALFTHDASGTGAPLMFDAGFHASDLLHPGDFVILYATGLGATNPPASSFAGGSSAEPLSRVTDEIEVFIGDQKAQVLFAGLAPGFPGVYQLNVYVPPQAWTDRLYLRQRNWTSNMTTFTVPPSTNVDQVNKAEFTLLFPQAAYSSLPFAGAQFDLDLSIRPDARSFAVSVVGEAGGWYARVDTANRMWEVFLTTPTQASRNGDFSIGYDQRPPVIDFLNGCTPFPGNLVPAARLNLGEVLFLNYGLASPNVTLPGRITGMLAQHGPEGTTFRATGAFGDFLQLPCGSAKTRKTAFTIYVDGHAVATRDVTFPILGR